MAEQKLYRMLDLVGLLKLSEGTIRNLMRRGLFPRPVYPIEGSTCWTEDQVDAYLKGLVHIPALGRALRKRKKKTSSEKGRQEKKHPHTASQRRTEQQNSPASED